MTGERVPNRRRVVAAAGIVEGSLLVLRDLTSAVGAGYEADICVYGHPPYVKEFSQSRYWSRIQSFPGGSVRLSYDATCTTYLLGNAPSLQVEAYITRGGAGAPDGPLEEYLEWEILPCPIGVPLDAHEIAVALLQDSRNEEATDPLGAKEAYVAGVLMSYV